MDQNICPTCGASLFSAFGAGAPEKIRPKRDPNVAAALSILPGAGQVYLGRIGDAIARFVMFSWWLAVVLLLKSPSLLFLRIAFGGGVLGLIGIAALDAYRQAGAPKTPAFMSAKVFLYASMASMAVLFFGLMATALNARGH